MAAVAAMMFYTEAFAGPSIGANDSARANSLDGNNIYARVMAAVRAGQRKVILPPGIYRVMPATETSGDSRYHMVFRGLHDLEIDAIGVTLLWQDRTRGGIRFDHCRNVVLRGATLQNEVMPFTQGKIVSFTPDRKSLALRIDTGYPADFDDARYFHARPGYVFDPMTGHWKAGTIDLYDPRVERLGDSLFRLTYERPIGPNVAVGDRMAFRGEGGTDILVSDCGKMRIEGVTIRNGSGFCVHEDGGEGGSYYSYNVARGPRPEGASVDPLIACNADGFHSSNVRHGPTLENCSFESMPDDGIAIHGTYVQVDHAEGRTLVVASRIPRIAFRGGDRLRLYDTKGILASETVVRDITALPNFRSSRPSTLRRYQPPQTLSYFRLTLDKPLDAGFDYLAADADACGAEFEIRHCTIRNNRARGILLKANNGRVENCTIDGSTIAGIVLGPEMLYWNEADYCRNIVIRNNTIRHTGYATTGPGNRQGAALTITADGEGPGNTDILVTGNTFDDIAGANIAVNAADGVQLRDNRFLNTHRTESRNGIRQGIEASSVIWLGACRNVVLSGNTVRNSGPFRKRLIALSTQAQNVSGANDGLQQIAP